LISLLKFEPSLAIFFPKSCETARPKSRRTRRKTEGESLFAAYLRALRDFVVKGLILRRREPIAQAGLNRTYAITTRDTESNF
jgi:hypothetical protein